MPAGITRSGGVDKYFLLPGDLVFAENQDEIHTLLGSCIAITLWHPQLKIGAMCHFVLASRGTHSTINFAAPNGRYLDEAMLLFEREVATRDTELRQYQIKIFGGSNSNTKLISKDKTSIGYINSAAAIDLLAHKGLQPLFAHIGGTGFRRITFDIGSGEVLVKHQPLR